MVTEPLSLKDAFLKLEPSFDAIDSDAQANSDVML